MLGLIYTLKINKMEILRFDEFLSESQEFDFDLDGLDEGLIDAVKSALSKPNLKDPKTAKDFSAMVSAVAAKLPSNESTPTVIATRLVNLLTLFLNKKGPFVGRSGNAVPKPLPMIGKDGVTKAVAGGAKNMAKTVLNAANKAKAAGAGATGSAK